MAFGKVHAISMIGLTILGLVILIISLITANRLSTGTEVTLTGNELYFGRKILPDHLFYPLLMVQDRLVFMAAKPEDQLMLRLAYADDRFESAQQLLKHNRDRLAVTTLTKSQKYIMLSGLELLSNDAIDLEKRQKVIEAVDHSVYRMQLVISQIEEPQKAAILKLIEETKVLQQQLEEKFPT